ALTDTSCESGVSPQTTSATVRSAGQPGKQGAVAWGRAPMPTGQERSVRASHRFRTPACDIAAASRLPGRPEYLPTHREPSRHGWLSIGLLEVLLGGRRRPALPLAAPR